MEETLRGTIERVTFHNPENGFSVLRVLVEVEVVTEDSKTMLNQVVQVS